MKRREYITLTGVLGGFFALTVSYLEGRNPVPQPEAEASAPAQTATPAVTQVPPTDTPQPSAEVTTSSEEPPADTGTGTATEAPTETPTERERRGARRLAEAEAELTNIVELFTRGYGEELTDVTASSTDILDMGVELTIAFADAQNAYTEAAEGAANEEQVRQAEQFRGCWHFLGNLHETQTEVTTGYQHLDDVREAFDRVEARNGRDSLDRLVTVRRRADRQFQNLSEGSTVDDATAITAITASEYENKLAQLEADTSLYLELDDTLRTFAEGIKWLGLAQAEMEKDDRVVLRAKDYAKWSKEEVRQAQRELIDLANNTDEDTSLRPMVIRFRDMTSEKIREANKILD